MPYIAGPRWAWLDSFVSWLMPKMWRGHFILTRPWIRRFLLREVEYHTEAEYTNAWMAIYRFRKPIHVWDRRI